MIIAISALAGGHETLLYNSDECLCRYCTFLLASYVEDIIVIEVLVGVLKLTQLLARDRSKISQRQMEL
jgi:hypothetical protein